MDLAIRFPTKSFEDLLAHVGTIQQAMLQNQQEIFTFSQAITYPLTTRQLNQTTPRIDENCHWSVGVIGLACKPWMAWFLPRQLSTVGRGEPLHLKSLEFLE